MVMRKRFDQIALNSQKSACARGMRKRFPPHAPASTYFTAFLQVVRTESGTACVPPNT